MKYLHFILKMWSFNVSAYQNRNLHNWVKAHSWKYCGKIYALQQTISFSNMRLDADFHQTTINWFFSILLNRMKAVGLSCDILWYAVNYASPWSGNRWIANYVSCHIIRKNHNPHSRTVTIYYNEKFPPINKLYYIIEYQN